MKRLLPVPAILVAIALAGCTGESALPNATGKGTIRALNAISTAPAISLLIEERLVGSADYKSATGAAQFDDLEYTFNFEARLSLSDTGRTRVASQFLDVVKDKEYTMVIGGALANPTITLWEGDTRQWDGSETVFETRFGHAAGSVDAVDVYFAAPGTAPVLGEAVGTLSFGEILPAIDRPEGDYVVTYTEVGLPMSVVFKSDPVARGAQGSSIITLLDADANDLATVAVRSFNAAGVATALTSPDFPPTLRFINASTVLGTSDVYIDSPPMTPLLTNHAFGDVTGDIEVTAGTTTFTYTAPDNIGSIGLEQDATVLAGRHTNFYVLDAAGVPVGVAALPNRRAVETSAKFTLVQAAANHSGLDLYIVAADTAIADSTPAAFGLGVGGNIALDLPPDSFDLYLTTSGEETVVAGPFRLDVALGDVVDLIVFDNVDPAIADIVVVPNL